MKVDLSQIYYIESIDDYVKVFLLNNNKPIMSKMTMKSISELLPSNDFLRVNRSFILSTSANIIIDGIFTIDNNFTFFQCPNIFLGPDAQIVMTKGKTLSIENSKLRAACNLMWKGILATNGTQTVKISKS